MAAGALREVFAFFGVKFDDKELVKGDKAVKKTTVSLNDFAGAMGTALSIGAITDFVRSTLQMSSGIRQAAIQVGATNQEVAALSAQFHQVGLETDDVADAISILQEKAVDATQGSQDAADAFKNLGVAYKDGHGNILSGVELFNRTTDALASTENASERVGNALILLGDPGRKLIPVLAGGTEQLRKMRKEAEELGGIPSQKFFEGTEKMSKSSSRLGIALGGVRNRIVTALLPSLIRGTNYVINLAVAFQKIMDKTDILKVALPILGVGLAAVGIALNAAFLAPIATMVLAAAALTVISLVVDDIITTFKGGNSVIQGFVDELYGVGTTRQVLNDLKAWWQGVIEKVNEAKAAVKAFFGISTEKEDGFSRENRGARDIAGEETGLPTGGAIVRTQRGARDIASDRDSVTTAYLAARAVRGNLSGQDTDIAGNRARGVSESRSAGILGETRKRQAMARASTGGLLGGDFVSGAAIYGDRGRIIGRESSGQVQGNRVVTVGDTAINLTINAADASAREVAIIVHRQLEATLASQRRATLEAFGDSETESAS